MSESREWKGELSSLLKNIYSCADKSTWYGKVVDAYDRTRPRYPSVLIDAVAKIARLEPGKEVLEIGSGPGIATVELVKIGLKVVAVEPNLTACEVARRKCADYGEVEFCNATFEDWQLDDNKFDAAIATTSFHWVAPEIRSKKTASALKEDGYLVLLWNTPPQPKNEVLAKLVPVYRVYTPELAQQEDIVRHQQNISKFGREIIDSGYYHNLVTQAIVSQVDYTIDEYLTLLTTLSPYIRLDSSLRDTLLQQLKSVLQQNYGDRLELSYLSMFQIAQKVTK